MNPASLFVVLVFGLIAGCSGNSYRMGGCPRVTVMKTLDFERFLGDWYVIQRFNPMATCTKITIEKGADDKYAVNETSRPFGLNFGFHNQYLKPRKVNFLRNDTNSIFRIQRDFAHFTLSTFGVVDTDYETYAVVWGCDPMLFGSIQNVDVLSREQKATPEVLQKSRDVLKEMHVDVHPLDNVDHTRCQSEGDGSNSVSSVDKNTNNIVVESP